MSLAGIVGNHDRIAGLARELAQRPSHAYLLSGPAGIGKALVAKGLAHAILCERSPGPNFCCKVENCPVRSTPASARPRASASTTPRCDCCAGCVQMATGVHPDFNYVARAANRSDVLIEQVRNLIDSLGVKPSRGPRRIAILDDAETLNLPAQNALLKTLEEPPGDTLLFLVSDNERAMLDTIRSRMRSVRFAPLATAEVAALLAARAGLDTERATALARLARGSIRRALDLVQGDEPPVRELTAALAQTAPIDFARAQSLAQEFFATRDQATANFELIARILEEMLCFKLLRTDFVSSGPEASRMLTQLSERLEVAAIAELVDRALKAHAAIDAMANSRLQAEQWWMAAGTALSGGGGIREAAK
jgi:DNA polymerase-3 subunit delta'